MCCLSVWLDDHSLQCARDSANPHWRRFIRCCRVAWKETMDPMSPRHVSLALAIVTTTATLLDQIFYLKLQLCIISIYHFVFFGFDLDSTEYFICKYYGNPFLHIVLSYVTSSGAKLPHVFICTITIHIELNIILCKRHLKFDCWPIFNGSEEENREGCIILYSFWSFRMSPTSLKEKLRCWMSYFIGGDERKALS